MENQSTSTSQNRAKRTETPQDSTFKRVFKGDREHVSDVFKLSEATFKNNVAYNFKNPQIIQTPHRHIYRSTQNNGLPNHQTSDNCGHFHNVKLVRNQDGTMNVK